MHNQVCGYCLVLKRTRFLLNNPIHELKKERVMSAQYTDLKDSSVLITGGASGIGADLVRAFCQQRARVAFIDIDTVAAQQLTAELVDAGGSVPVFGFCDLAELGAIKGVIDKLSQSCGAFTVLVNNAAVGRLSRIADISDEALLDQVGIIFLGAV